MFFSCFFKGISLSWENAFYGLTCSDGLIKHFYFTFITSFTIGYGDMYVFVQDGYISWFGVLYTFTSFISSIFFLVVLFNILMLRASELNRTFDFFAKKLSIKREILLNLPD